MNMIVRVVFLVLTCSSYGLMSAAYSGSIQESTPSNPSPDARYQFFLHGKIVEKKWVPARSKKFGEYKYREMLITFADAGFEVISEARSSGTGIHDYSVKVAGDVNTLIDAGVPAKNITISGFSKGGRMALVVSSLLGNKDVNYVVLAGCRSSDIDNLNLHPTGRILSMYDSNDDSFESCSKIFSAGGEGLVTKEIVLEIGGGHGVFYRPIDEWVKPLVSWAIQ